MKKNIRFIIIILIGLLLITGCTVENEVETQSNEDSKLKTELNVDQISETEFSINIQNGKKGDTKSGYITLKEGENINEDYSFHGTKSATSYIIPKGKTKKEALMSGLLNGEGNSTSMDIPAGEYEILLEVEDDSLTGTYTAKAVKTEEE